jgi:hypothetical protein
MFPQSRLSLVLLLVAGLGGCATAMTPQNVEGTAASIRAAEEVGAAKVPEAALRLQLAKEQLQRARTMTAKQQQPAAHRLVMRSHADAELALALTRSSVARAAAKKATERNMNIQGNGPATVDSR